MNNKTTTTLKIVKNLHVKFDNGSKTALLTEGDQTYLQFNAKGKNDWFLGTVTRLCKNAMYVLDNITGKNHRFLYCQLQGVSDKCPM